MLTWGDVCVVVKTVAGARPSELAALQGQLAAQGVLPALTAAGEPGEAPRDNFRRVLRLGAASGREWLLHLEDDAYLAPDFAAKALALIGRGTANLWTFYSARKEDGEALAAGKECRRVTPGAFANTQAVAFPCCLIPHLLAYLPEWEAKHPEHRSAVDYFLGAFCRRERLLIQASVPSLVQHRAGKSLLGHRARFGRVSRTFAAAYGEVPPC